MAWPGEVPWSELGATGFQHVVCLASERPAYDPTPLHLLAAVRLDDNYGGRSPRDPERDRAVTTSVVCAVLDALARGEGVVIHCQGGTGRTGTVLGCLLRALGHTPAQVLKYFQLLNAARGRQSSGWPESDWQRMLVSGFSIRASSEL